MTTSTKSELGFCLWLLLLAAIFWGSTSGMPWFESGDGWFTLSMLATIAAVCFGLWLHSRKHHA